MIKAFLPLLLTFVSGSKVMAEQPLTYTGSTGPGVGKHIVFLAGDHEYRSEESLPQLARIMAKHHGFKCTVLFNIDKQTGEIVAGNSNMPGIEALDNADLAVVFLRFQNFPPEQMKHFDAYLRRGGPIVGLRTATHAFKTPASDPYSKYSYDSKASDYELGFGHQVLGQTWVGHYGKNHAQSTRINVVQSKSHHPIMRGVQKAWVQAGGYVGKPTDGEILTFAQPLDGMTENSPADATKPPQPSEWTRTYKSASGINARVFTSLYGASEDLLNEGYRRMIVNGMFWALGLEDAIKPTLTVDLVGPFKPNTFRGGGHAGGIKPTAYAGYESQIPAHNNVKSSPAKSGDAAQAKQAAAESKPAPPAEVEPATQEDNGKRKRNNRKDNSQKPQETKEAEVKPRLAEVPADYRDPLPFRFNKGETIAIVGNGLPDRMQHDGWFETLLQSELRDQEIRFRNMSASGDRPDSFPRSKGAATMTEYLQYVQADAVFAFFGYNESFAGVKGADEHRKKLVEFVQRTRGSKANGKSFPRIVLFSPIAFENTKNPNFPDGRTHNVRLEAYTKATEAAAKETGVEYVDLFHPSLDLYKAASTPLTINGVHLTEEGNRQISEVIASKLLSKPVRASMSMETLRSSVKDKEYVWNNRYRARDGNDVWGGRSTLKFVNDQSNAEVLQHELTMLDVMTANRDKKVWATAKHEDWRIDDSNTPPPVTVVSNVGGGSKSSSAVKEGTLNYINGQDAIKQMGVAKGFEVNLFADESRFPELVNPVQMQYDTKGRLWVAVWPTYPKWEPLKEMNDALLIVHDDDNDGKADRTTEFARVQNPLGFEFWNGGVIVTSTPELLFLRDTNGDDVADERIVLFQGLDSSDTHHAANNLIYGPDGAIYWQSGVFMVHNHEHPWGPSLQTEASAMYRFDPRRFTISMHAINSPNPHGIAFDYWGYHYATDGTGGKAYQVRPEGKGFKMHELLKKEVRPVTASEVVSSSHFPESMQGDFLICNVIGFLGIKHYDLARNAETGTVWGEPAGDELSVNVTNADGTVTPDNSRGLLMSGDKNFRPSDAIFAPDGSLVFCDWHNAIIGHMQHNIRDPNRDHIHGRIYRVTATGRPLQNAVKIDGQPIAALLENLKSPIDGVRHRTRVELSERNTAEVIAETKKWMSKFDPNKKEDAHHLLEALWLHQQHNVRNYELMEQLLNSPEPHARIAAGTVKHLWFNVESTMRGGVIGGINEGPEVKSGVLSDTPELTTIRIGTVLEKMKYNVTELSVKPGKKVKLTFANPDFMPHNILLVKPGKADDVGLKAIALGASGFSVGYVPKSDDILWASKLLDHAQEEVIEFTAPSEEGAYPYICSFPGHHLAMRGVLYVTNDLKAYLEKNPVAVAKNTEWKLSDLEDDLSRVGRNRNHARGQMLFTSLACAQCHQSANPLPGMNHAAMNPIGNLSEKDAAAMVAIGPKVSEILTKFKSEPKAILQEILEPSRNIEDKYRKYTFMLDDDSTVAGNIIAETTDSITVQITSPVCKEQKIEKATIVDKKPSQLSIMPIALLNTLDEEQILDLLAFVLADGKADAPAFKESK